MRLSDQKLKEIQNACREVRRAVTHASAAAIIGDRAQAYAAAERAQDAAFELRLLFAPTGNQMLAALQPPPEPTPPIPPTPAGGGSPVVEY